MKSLLAAALLLVPLAALGDDSSGLQPPLRLSVNYAGTGQYSFEGNTYDYAGLLAAMRAEYAARHITSIEVDMGDGSLMGDKPKICHLKLDTGARVKLRFVSDGQTNTIFCP